MIAQDLVDPAGNHLVGIHVVTRSGASLEGIHDELAIPPAIDDLLRCLDDGLAPIATEQPQIHVDNGSGLLDDSYTPHECAIGFHPADGKVLDGTHGLCPI